MTGEIPKTYDTKRAAPWAVFFVGLIRLKNHGGKPEPSLHDLRHSFASVLANEGLSLPVIGGLLGHSRPETTARYAHLQEGTMRVATGKSGNW